VRPLAASAAAVAALLTIGPKAVNYAGGPAQPPDVAEARVVKFMQRHGWSAAGAVELTADGTQRLLRFRAPGCADAVRIAPLPLDGQTVSIVTAMVGPSERLFYVDRGEPVAAAPSLAYLREKLRAIAGRLAFAPQAASPYLAVIEGAACHLETDLPWPSMWPRPPRAPSPGMI
jgi:hypothetical protein